MNAEDDVLAIMQRHYGNPQLLAALHDELAGEARERRFSAAELAMLDQLHTRGYGATVDLAAMVAPAPKTRVLDIGAGLGGPARYLAEAYDCVVTGIDATSDLVDAARYLSTRWSGPLDQVTFTVGDALALPYAADAFDLVWMQHVAMNIRDRGRLYGEVRRVLGDGGTFATYDVIAKGDELVYPTPWATDAAASTVLDAEQTRRALEAAGFAIRSWTIDTPAALEWVARVATAPLPAGGPPRGARLLHAALGDDFANIVANLGRNYVEGRADVLAVTADAV